MKTLATCPVCASEAIGADARATRHLNLAAPFSVGRCTACGLRFLVPMPSENDYAAVYAQAYYAGGRDDAPAAQSWYHDYPSIDAYRQGDPVRARYIADKVRRLSEIFPRRGRLLDVGCAYGEFLCAARDAGWAVHGIEPSEDGVRACREQHGLDVRQSLLGGYQPDLSFDLIYSNHVFEHLVEPREGLRKMASMLAPGGRLMIEVPNQFEAWVRKLTLGVKSLLGRSAIQRSLGSIHHPYFYDPTTLRRLFESEGFHVQAMRTHFPERWHPGGARRVLRLIDRAADRIAHQGECIELVAGRE
jgi:2-polyprenyl-3-methyl-5-hydroxy-6-metoxy-1,4-benzoquinol methylase